MRAEEPFPVCECKTPDKVRPHILFYNDAYFNTERSDK